MVHPYLTYNSHLRPERVRPIPQAFFRNAADMTVLELSFVVLELLLGDEVSSPRLKQMLTDSLVPDGSEHWPTARFVARVVKEFTPSQPILVPVTDARGLELAHYLNEAGVKFTALVPHGYGLAVEAPKVLVVQGSAADCKRIVCELPAAVSVCSPDCAVGEAMEVARAFHCALHHPKRLPLMLTPDVADVARRMGLAEAAEAVAPVENGSVPSTPQFTHHHHQHSTRRVAPTASAVLKELYL